VNFEDGLMRTWEWYAENYGKEEQSLAG